MGDTSRVVIGMDPHKRTVTIEAMAASEAVLDVPAKLSARMRFYATGQGRKTDETDATPWRWSGSG